jgi:hypothetical protein
MSIFKEVHEVKFGKIYAYKISHELRANERLSKLTRSYSRSVSTITLLAIYDNFSMSIRSMQAEQLPLNSGRVLSHLVKLSDSDFYYSPPPRRYIIPGTLSVIPPM